MTAKERNLLKGAIRRVFARSDLRRAILAISVVDYSDEKRPRVKKWSLCPVCSQYIPTYLMVVDHVEPLVPISTSLENMSWDTVIDRTWCEKNNLKAICKPCHKIKTKRENKERKRKMYV